MAVIEVGVIFNGVPAYVSNFSEDIDESAIILKSALLSAIQSTIHMLYGESSKEFKFKKLRILLEFIETHHNVIIYAVADLDSKVIFPIKTRLKDLCKNVNQLLEENELNQFNRNKNHNSLDPIVTELFKDLQKSSLDRLNQLL